MATSEDLRSAIAGRWRPIVQVLSATPVVWETLRRLGLEWLPSLSKLPLGALALIYAAVFAVVRFPRISLSITRCLLGRQETRLSDTPLLFRGARSYTEDEPLPGRKAELARCRLELRGSPFFIIEGESGCGKSSFVQSALLPLLKREYTVVQCRVNERPLLGLYSAILGKTVATDEAALTSELILAELGERRPPSPRLIIFDQFEEIFLTTKDVDRVRFWRVVHDLIRDSVTSVIVVTRTDFLDLVLKLSRDVDNDQNVFDLGKYFTISAFARTKAEDVLLQILQPLYEGDPVRRDEAEEFSKALIAELLRPPRDNRLCPDDEKSVLPVEMQIVGLLLETRGNDMLSAEALRALGGKTGLMQDYIKSATDFVWRRTGVSPAHCLLVIRSLVSQFNTKRSLSVLAVREITNLLPRDIARVLDAFAAKYLVRVTIVRDGDQDEVVYELMHDHLATILSEAPDPTLQKVRDAEARLAFWREHTRIAYAPKKEMMSRVVNAVRNQFRQPIPIGECISLRSYAASRVDRELIDGNLRAFGLKAAIVVLLGILPVFFAFRSLTIASGFAIIPDAFQTAEAYKESGFVFSSAKQVPWNSREADLMVSNAQDAKWPVVRFFSPQDIGYFSGGPSDLPANAGLLFMARKEFNEIRSCPLQGYRAHWFPPDPPDPALKKEVIEIGDVFCVRLRDGRTYAKLVVTGIEKHKIAFTWVYQRLSFLGFY